MLLEGLRGTDARVANDEPVSPAFLFALLLWPAYCRALMALQAQGVHAAEAQRRAADRVTVHQLDTIALAAPFLAADAGDLAAAVALLAAPAQARVAPAGASAFPRRVRFPACCAWSASDEHAEDVAFWREAQAQSGRCAVAAHAGDDDRGRRGRRRRASAAVAAVAGAGSAE